MAYLILQYVILWNRNLGLRVCGRSLSLTCVPQSRELGAEKVGWALLVPRKAVGPRDPVTPRVVIPSPKS